MFKYSGFIVALIFSQTLAQTSTSNAAAQSATATPVVNPVPAQATQLLSHPRMLLKNQRKTNNKYSLQLATPSEQHKKLNCNLSVTNR